MRSKGGDFVLLFLESSADVSFTPRWWWFISQSADTYTATRRAGAAMFGLVQRHAAMLSFVEAFWIMGVMFVCVMPLLFVLRRAGHEPLVKPVKKSEVTPMPAPKPAKALARAAGQRYGVR